MDEKTQPAVEKKEGESEAAAPPQPVAPMGKPEPEWSRSRWFRKWLELAEK